MVIKQPNGLYCIFDDIDDQPIEWNITPQQYIDAMVKEARKEALSHLKHSRNIKYVYKNFCPDENMSENLFNNFLKEVGSNETYESIHKLTKG